MNFLIHHWLEGVCLLLVAVGLWLLFRSAWRSSDRHKALIEDALGTAVFNLGFVFLLIATSVRTDVSFDAWSTSEKLIGGLLLLLLLSVGVQVGFAIERWRQHKRGAGEAQRVGSVGLS